MFGSTGYRGMTDTGAGDLAGPDGGPAATTVATGHGNPRAHRRRWV